MSSESDRWRRRRAGLAKPRSPSAPAFYRGNGSNGNANGHGRGLPPLAGGFSSRAGSGNGNGGTDGNGVAGPPRLRRRRAGLYRRPRRPRRVRILRWLLISLGAILVLCSIGAGVAFAGYNVYKSELPDAATIAADEPPQDSYVYDTSGRIIYVFAADQGYRHTHVALANISRWLRLATIDIEDRHFYSEGSWDLPRLVEAGINDITHGATQGASTITEQLAKISFFGSNTPRSLDYKIKEIVLGNEIAANFTKNQVLEMYLNRIFYGNYALGIQTAAQLYFFTDASKLDLAQSAMLAGLPQSPSVYNPLFHEPNQPVNPAAKARQLQVLDAMVNNGDITQKQANAAYAEPLTFHSWTESSPMNAPDFLGFLQSWLKAHFADSYLKPGGWRIYTTLDGVKQYQAELVVLHEIRTNGATFNMHDAALVSIDPKTGELIDMVGSGDPAMQYFGNENLATARVSPGSAIKLFTYAAAIASGKFTMTTPILDAPYKFQIPGAAPYSPMDYDQRWHGVCQLKTCLGNSFNMPAVKVEAATGIPYIDSVELAAGVHSLNSTCYQNGTLVNQMPGPYSYAATLGALTCGITLTDLADGAATIADLGIQHDVVPATKIVDSNGNVIWTYDPNAAGRRALPDNVSYILDEITSNDANRAAEFGTGGLLTLPDRRVSAKTGTGAFFQDNLTVGWTPDFLTAVWVGNRYPQCPNGAAEGPDCGYLNGISSGITGAAPIWHNFMVQAVKGTPATWYTRPGDVIASGPGDDANFFLPSAQKAYTGGCYYWGPAPDPNNPCLYTGTEPPPWYVPPQNSNPSPGALPTPEPKRKHPRPTPPAPGPPTPQGTPITP